MPAAAPSPQPAAAATSLPAPAAAPSPPPGRGEEESQGQGQGQWETAVGHSGEATLPEALVLVPAGEKEVSGASGSGAGGKEGGRSEARQRRHLGRYVVEAQEQKGPLAGLVGCRLAAAHFFGFLGRAVARSPWHFLGFGLLLQLALLPGILLLKGDSLVLFLRLSTDFLEDFSPTGSRYFADYEFGNSSFAEARVSRLILTPSAGNFMSKAFLEASLQLESDLFDLEVSSGGGAWNFSSLCERTYPGGPCDYLSLSMLLVPDPSVLDGVADDANRTTIGRELIEALPVESRPLLELLVGGDNASWESSWPGGHASVEELVEWLSWAESTRVMMKLRPGDASRALEKRIADFVNDLGTGADPEVSALMASSEEEEAAAAASGALAVLLAGCAVMAAYAAACLAAQTRVPGATQAIAVLLAALWPPLSSIAALGLFGLAGVKVSVLAVPAPLLASAVGIDGLFVVVSSLMKVGDGVDDLEEAMARALLSAGPAVSLTTFVTTAAFAACAGASAAAGLPGFVRLSALFAVVVLLAHLGSLVVAPALLALDERWTAWRRRRWSQERSPKQLRLNPARAIRASIEEDYAPMPESSKALIVVGILLLLGTFAFGFAGADALVLGSPSKYLLPDDSPVSSYADELTAWYLDAELVEVGIVFSRPTLGSLGYRIGLATFMASLSAESGVLLTDCWLADLSSTLDANATEEEAEAAVTAYLGNSTGLVSHRDALLLSAGSLAAARCRLFARWTAGTSDGDEAGFRRGPDLVDLADAADISVAVYHASLATSTAWREELKDSLFASLGYAALAVLVALLLALPVPMAIGAAVSGAGSVLTLLGVLYIAGITINIVTYAACLMALGLCTDSSCHVCCAAAHAVRPPSSVAFRWRRALELSGHDVLHGAAAAVLGALIALAADSDAFRIVSLANLVVLVVSCFLAMVSVPAFASVAGQLGTQYYKSWEVSEFLADNGTLKSKDSGIHLRKTRCIDDVHETLILPWGTLVQGSYVGSEWVKTLDGLYVPTELGGSRVLVPAKDAVSEYVLDNRVLKAPSRGLRHRQSRSMDDQHPSAGSYWFDFITGVDMGDGWFRNTEGNYLPTVLDGVRIIRKPEDVEEDYVLDNRALEAKTAGVRYRKTRNHTDLCREAADWGSIVRGVDMLDGWFRTSDRRFLPAAVDYVPMLTRKADLTDEELAALQKEAKQNRKRLKEEAKKEKARVRQQEEEHRRRLQDPNALPLEWEEHEDPELKRSYYVNRTTGVSTWARPQKQDGGSEEAKDKLADGWQEEVDPSTGMSYYYDRATGATTWVRPRAQHDESNLAATIKLPDGWSEEVDPRTGKSYYIDSSDGFVSWGKPIMQDDKHLPAGWEGIIDPASGKVYYVNRVQNITQWGTPRSQDAEEPLPEGWERAVDPQTRAVHYVNREQGLTQVERPAMEKAPLPEGWEEVNDPSVGIYYQNLEQGITQWERPRPEEKQKAPEGWQQVMDPDSGKPYYVHAASGQSKWSTPRTARSKGSAVELPEGWEVAIDMRSGRKYYLNRELQVTRWDTPRLEGEEPPTPFDRMPSVASRRQSRLFEEDPAPRPPLPPCGPIPSSASPRPAATDGEAAPSARGGRSGGAASAAAAAGDVEALAWAEAERLSSQANWPPGTYIPPPPEQSQAAPAPRAAFLPSVGSWLLRPKVEEQGPAVEYFVDNSLLKSTSPGLRHRKSRRLDDFHKTAATAWGLIVRGWDLGDGWLRTTDNSYLPMEIEGARVLLLRQVQEKFVVTTKDACLADERPHLTIKHHNTRNLSDTHDSRGSTYGETVRGQLMGDGWFRTDDGLYIPTEVDGEQVLLKPQDVEALRRTASLEALAGVPEVEVEPELPVFTDFASLAAAPPKTFIAQTAAGLGRWAAGAPLCAVAGVLLVFAAFLPGLALLEGDAWIGFLRINTDFFEEFAPLGTSYRSDYDFSTSHFLASRESRLVYSPAEGGPLFTEAFLVRAMQIESEIIQDLRAEHEGAFYGYGDVCARSFEGGPCKTLSVFDLLVPGNASSLFNSTTDQVELAKQLVSPLTTDERALLPALVGNPHMLWPGDTATNDTIAQWLAGGRAVQTLVKLQPSAASRAFEVELGDFMDDQRESSSSAARVSGELYSSVPKAFSDLLFSAWISALVSAVVVLLYGMACLAGTRVPGRGALAQAAAVGCALLLPVLTVPAAWGAMGYLGLRVNVLAAASALLLGFGGGAGAVFALAGAWQAAGPAEEDLREVGARALERGGSAVVTSSLVSVAALLGASATSSGISLAGGAAAAAADAAATLLPGFETTSEAAADLLAAAAPGLAAAGFAAAASVLFTALGLCVLTPALLALAERRGRGKGSGGGKAGAGEAGSGQAAGGDGEAAEADDGAAGAACTAAAGEPLLRRMFGQEVAPLPAQSFCFKLCGGLVLMPALVAVGAFYMSKLEGGVPDRFFYPDGTYLSDFHGDVERSFRSQRVREVGLILKTPALESAAYRAGLEGLLQDLRNRSDVAKVDCWLEAFANGTSTSADASEVSVALFAFLASPSGEAWIRDASLAGGALEAARCAALVWQPVDVGMEAQQCEELTALAAAASVPALLTHSAWPTGVARREEGTRAVLTAAGGAFLAASLVLLLALPPGCALVAILAAGTSAAAALGFIQAAGSTCNVLTYSVSIMAVALSAERACLIAHSASHCSAPPLLTTVGRWSAKSAAGLTASGYEALQASLCVCLAALPIFALGGSEAARWWGGTTVVASLLSCTASVVCLPSLLALLGDVRHLPQQMRAARAALQAAYWEAVREEREEREEEEACRGAAQEEALSAADEDWDVLDEPRLSCISDRVTRFLRRACRIAARAAARKPGCFIFLGLVGYLLLMPGLFMLKGDAQVFLLRVSTDLTEDFSDHTSAFYDDYTLGVSQFPETRRSVLTFVPEQGNLTSLDFLSAGVEVEAQIRALTAQHDGVTYSFEDVCARAYEWGPCEVHAAFDILDPAHPVARNISQAQEVAQSLVNNLSKEQRRSLQQLVANPDNVWPGISNRVKLATWLAAGTAAQTFLQLRPGAASRAFERKLQEFLEERKGGDGILRMAGALEMSLGEESANLCGSAVWLITLTSALMLCYAVVFLAAQTRVRGHTQILLITAGCLIPGAASLAAYGVLGYFGLRISFLGVLGPFLGIASGVDSLFILIGALRAADPTDSNVERVVARVLAKGGPGIASTWLTSIVAFAVAAVFGHALPNLAVFCLLLMVTLTLGHLGILLIFPAMMALNERRIAGGRRDLLFWRVRRTPVGQGSTPLSRMVRRLHLGSRFKAAFQTHYAPLVKESRVFRRGGAAIYAFLVVVGLALLRDVGRGMPDRDFARDESYLQSFFDDAEAAFGGAKLERASLLLPEPRLNETDYRTGLAGLVTALEERSDVAGVACWPNALSDANSATSAATLQWLASNGVAWRKDAALEDDELLAARCGVHFWQPIDPASRSDQATAIRDLAAAANVSATIYHESWPTHAARHTAISRLLIQSVGFAGVAILATLMLFLPAHLAIIAALNVAFAVATVFASMALAGLTCNVVTYTALVAAIGFVVDYTCHVCYCSRHGVPRGLSWRARMGRSLDSCGVEVLHGCITAVLGVALLGFAGSHAIRVWSGLTALIAGCGGFFALVGLPATVAFLEEEGFIASKRPKQVSDAVVPFKYLEPPASPKAIVAAAFNDKVLVKGLRVLLKGESAARAAFEGSGFSWDAHRPDFTNKVCMVSDVDCFDGKGFKVHGCPYGWPLEAIEEIFDREVAAEVVVTIEAASGLRAAKFPSARRSDPFCTLEVIGKPTTKIKTPVCKGTVSPEWNCEVQLQDYLVGEALLFEVWDKDFHGKNNHFLGRARLGARKFYPNGFKETIDLTDAGEQMEAKLKVNVVVKTREKWGVPKKVLKQYGEPKPSRPGSKRNPLEEQPLEQPTTLVPVDSVHNPYCYTLPGEVPQEGEDVMASSMDLNFSGLTREFSMISLPTTEKGEEEKEEEPKTPPRALPASGAEQVEGQEAESVLRASLVGALGVVEEEQPISQAATLQPSECASKQTTLRPPEGSPSQQATMSPKTAAAAAAGVEFALTERAGPPEEASRQVLTMSPKTAAAAAAAEKGRQTSPKVAPTASSADIQEEESDHVELTFKDLSLQTLDQEAFKAGLKAGMAKTGISKDTLNRMRIQLREGSIIATIFGPTEGLAEIRSAPLAEVEVMGCKAVVTKGAEPLVFRKQAEEDSWYCLDNSVLKAETRGLRKRLSKDDGDLHETESLTWGSVVRGVETGDGWFRCSEDGLYFPMTVKGIPVIVRKEVAYFTDNSLLRSATRGLRHRASKGMSDYAASSTPWGDIISGIDSQDGWFKLSGQDIYLPTKVKGVPVLYPCVDGDEEYVVDNSSLKASSRGLRHRSSKNDEDYHPDAGSCWGTTVRGVDLGDGWFRVTATQSYLPMRVNGKVVLITKASKEALRRESLEARRRAAFMMLPSVAAWLQPRLEEPPIPPPPYDRLPPSARAAPRPPYPPPMETPRGSTPLPSHRSSARGLTPLPSHRSSARGLTHRSAREQLPPPAGGPTPLPSHRSAKRPTPREQLPPPSHRSTRGPTPRGPTPLPSHRSARGPTPRNPVPEEVEVDEDMPLVLAVAPGVQEPLEAPGPPVEELEQEMVTTLRPSELDDDGLPEEWDEVYDPSMGRSYYYNRFSGQTTWARPGGKGGQPDLPPDWQEEVDPQTGMSYYFNPSNGLTTWSRPGTAQGAEEAGGAIESIDEEEEPLPAGWQEEVDPTTGKKYYYDRIRGAISHERPTEEAELPEGWDAVVDPTTGKTYYQNLELNTVQWDTPRIVKQLPEGWEVVFDSISGRHYYQHILRGETQWNTPRCEAEEPLPEGWEAAVDGNTGTTYYANRWLGLAQWERPTAASAGEDGNHGQAPP